MAEDASLPSASPEATSSISTARSSSFVSSFGFLSSLRARGKALIAAASLGLSEAEAELVGLEP